MTDKKVSFKEYLKKDEKWEEMLSTSSSLNDLLSSANKINDSFISNKVIKEIDERNNKYKSIINDSSFTHLNKALERITASTTAVEKAMKSIEPLSNSIAPISKIYTSELASLQSSIKGFDVYDIINSDAFNEVKKLQRELARLEPNINVFPITTLERSLELKSPDAFEKAKKEVEKIKEVEELHLANVDFIELDNNPYKDKSVDVLIVTGLPLELRIFCDVFDVKKTWVSEKFITEYYFSTVKTASKEYSIALAYGEDMGNFFASQVTNAAIDDLSPKLVISAGIGYTLNPSKLQLCDLHITDQIIYWGLTSKEHDENGRKVRATPVRVKSNHIFQEVRKYINNINHGLTPFKKWKKNSKADQPRANDKKVKEVLKEIDSSINCGVPENIFNEYPQVEDGKTMISDDAVVASLEEIKKRSQLKSGNESPISGEMEAAGIAMSLSNRRAHIEFLAVRGICDFGYKKESLEKSSSEFRRITALRAATFIKNFIESNPTLPKTEDGRARLFGTNYHQKGA